MAQERTPQEQSLRNKLAIVTGAGKSNGIGFAIAQELAEHGADIVLHYNSNKESAEKNVEALCKLGIKAVTVQGDATDIDFGANLIKATLEAFPERTIDIIVNNHTLGTFNECASVVALDAFDSVFHGNVRALHGLFQAAVPHLTTPGARLVNISSLASRQASMLVTYYSASKAAADNLVRCWAEELGPKGITVNTVAPGPIDAGQVPPEEAPVIQKLRMEQSVKRNGTPAEVAIAVSFLVHPKASFITGQRIPVDGGINF